MSNSVIPPKKFAFHYLICSHLLVNEQRDALLWWRLQRNLYNTHDHSFRYQSMAIVGGVLRQDSHQLVTNATAVEQILSQIYLT